MNEENCIFCKIIKKEIPSKIIFENENNLVFLDIFPINEGHTIVIPKNHYSNIEDLPINELSIVFKVVKETATLLHDKLGIGGYNILQNNFKPAGQEIDHFHVHIIPRNDDDKKFILRIPRNQATEEELDEILNKLKS